MVLAPQSLAIVVSWYVQFVVLPIAMPAPVESRLILPAKVVEAVLPDEAVAPARICFAVTDAAAGLLACGGGCSSSGWWLGSEERWLMWIWARGLVTSRRWLLSAARIWDLAEADLG
ncbi:hypothetical protein Dimus_000108 [Dionaea muscipula]